MESVIGLSLRFVSLGIWTLLIVGAVYAPVYAVAWSVDAARPELFPVAFPSTLVLSFLCVYLPTVLAWFLCQTLHEWGSLNGLVSKGWTRTPVWRTALSLKSGSKLTMSLLLLICTASLGALHVSFVCAIMQSDKTQAMVPFWILMPFGALHALSYLIQGKHRVSYPAAHMPRLQQLLDIAVAAVKDGVHVWVRAAIVASVLAIFIFKPSLMFKQVFVAALTSFCFTLALSWSSGLVNILMAERLNRRGLQHVDHGVVRSLSSERPP